MNEGDFAPELELLTPVLGARLAELIVAQPGGWRTLSPRELRALGLSRSGRQRVLALQELVKRSWPKLSEWRLLGSDDVGRVYQARLAGLDHEQLVAVALDGRNHLIGETVVAVGGCGFLSVTPADIFRPLIRSAARAFVLCHNHPSGDPTPSDDDIRMTKGVANVGDVVGIQLLDHIIVARDGFTSLADIISTRKEPAHAIAADLPR